MTPLRIVAEVPGQIALPNGAIALDSLLTWAAATRDELPPPFAAEDCSELGIPIAKDEHGFFLCSDAIYELSDYDVRYINRRAPIDQYQMLGPATGRVGITAGVDKGYRIPLEVGHLVHGTIEWLALGDADEIRDLLGLVHYLGKKRSVGLGKVSRWEVESSPTWRGFPVMTRAGKPLRALPLDYPGLVEPSRGYATLGLPRWDRSKETLCAIPERHH